VSRQRSFEKERKERKQEMKTTKLFFLPFRNGFLEEFAVEGFFLLCYRLRKCAHYGQGGEHKKDELKRTKLPLCKEKNKMNNHANTKGYSWHHRVTRLFSSAR